MHSTENADLRICNLVSRGMSLADARKLIESEPVPEAPAPVDMSPIPDEPVADPAPVATEELPEMAEEAAPEATEEIPEEAPAPKRKKGRR